MNIKKSISEHIIAFLPSVFIVVVPIITSALILSNLGWLVGLFVESSSEDKFNFARIFEQTKDARLSLHCLLPIVLGVLFYIICFYLPQRIKNKGLYRFVKIFVFVLLLMVAIICALMFARVNDVRFCDLLSKLLPLIDKL